MLTAEKVKREQLEDYYDKDDYYFKRDENLEVLGSGVKLYGLDKLKTDPRKLFAELTKNRDRKAIDLTFSPPKSLSILFATGDEEFREIAIQAQKTAIKTTLKYIEENGFFRTEKKKNGQVISSPATGMVVLPVSHSLNRNKEPQLHDHALIANSGIDPDGKDRAVDYGYIYRNRKHLDMIYKSALRSYLEEFRISTRSTEDGFEIADITQEQIDRFSSRAAQVEMNLACMGLTRKTATAEQRQMAALKDRPTKVDVDLSNLENVWKEMVKRGGDLHRAQPGDRLKRRDAPII